MSARTGLGRHGRIEDAAGDPLEGLVNLFDIGVVLAIAFLLAGLSVTLDQRGARRQQQRASAPTTSGAQTLPSTANAPATSGRGHPVGTVYRLGDGRLVFVPKPGG